MKNIFKHHYTRVKLFFESILTFWSKIDPYCLGRNTILYFCIGSTLSFIYYILLCLHSIRTILCILYRESSEYYADNYLIIILSIGYSLVQKVKKLLCCLLYISCQGVASIALRFEDMYYEQSGIIYSSFF